MNAAETTTAEPPPPETKPMPTPPPPPKPPKKAPPAAPDALYPEAKVMRALVNRRRFPLGHRRRRYWCNVLNRLSNRFHRAESKALRP